MSIPTDMREARRLVERLVECHDWLAPLAGTVADCKTTREAREFLAATSTGTDDGRRNGAAEGTADSPDLGAPSSPLYPSDDLRERLSQRLLREFVNQVPSQPPLVIGGSAYHIVDFVLDELRAADSASANLSYLDAIRAVRKVLPNAGTYFNSFRLAASIVTELGWRSATSQPCIACDEVHTGPCSGDHHSGQD